MDTAASGALGAIAALRGVAGPDNLVGSGAEALSAALTFPDMLVRVKAALALAAAMPDAPFTGSQRVVPILAETMPQTGGDALLVIDPDQQNLNRVMGALRDERTLVIGETQPYAALERARRELPAVSAVFMATDPVSSAYTDLGRWLYGAGIGVMVVLVRVVNPAYPEGMMLAILFMNMFAPLIDHFVVQGNIKRRLARDAV